MSLLLRTAVLFLLLPVCCWAGLEWEKEALEITVERPEKQVTTAFRFRNGTDAEISISDIQTSCGCTVASDARGTYPPGKEGELAVTFVVGNRKGRQDASIVVTESDGKKTGQTVLKLRVNLPDTIHLSKERLTWEMGDPLETQVVRLNIVDPAKTKLVSVKSMSSQFQVEQEVLGQGEVELRVKPISTDIVASGSLMIEILEPEARTLFFPLQIR